MIFNRSNEFDDYEFLVGLLRLTDDSLVFISRSKKNLPVILFNHLRPETCNQRQVTSPIQNIKCTIQNMTPTS